MASDADKENITGLLFASKAASPKKAAMKKTRSLSMGPGLLGPPLKEDSGNRRKSAFPAVKSIIAGPDEDAAKRREARRKSLARRRVSFAPEATLHTWDVVEYMRDATTSSSASSEATRRASSTTQSSAPQSPAPQSPAVAGSTGSPSRQQEQAERIALGELSPDSQRDADQRKNRRRSSGIPPLNFNNPDDVYSSSPLSGADSSPASSDSLVIDNGEDDADDTAMSLVIDEELTVQSVGSNVSDDNSSSERLDAALRQATMQAGNQMLQIDEGEEISMEIAGDEVTNAFKAFAGRAKRDSPGQQKVVSMLDQENINPFSPAFGLEVQRHQDDELDDGTQDMSMDITRAMGRILSHTQESSPQVGMASEQKGNKRRRLSTSATSDGSPAVKERAANRRSSLRPRRSSAIDVEDGTMDFTTAVGGIIKQGIAQPEQPLIDLGDETMDFTMVQGGILSEPRPTEVVQQNMDEDMSMDLTVTVDKTIKMPQLEVAPATPSPVKLKKKATPTKSPRKSPRRSIIPQPSPRLIETDSPRLEVTEDKEDEVILATPPQKELLSTPQIYFSPLKETAAKAHTLSDSIRLLNTPRKQDSSPTKKLIPTPKKAATPQKSATPKRSATPKKAMTPQRVTPRKRVRMEEIRPEDIPDDDEDAGQEEIEGEKIHLQDFLNLTNIRFMDLTTTKRRHTGFPGADRNLDHDLNEDDEQPSLESNVAAAVGVLPVLSMYQHMCHEMKNYISGGREELRILESEIYENQPPLFKDYLAADPNERGIMDVQFRNMKTNARLQSKAGWHAWRGQLLGELQKGLDHSVKDFERDVSLLTEQEEVLKASLPPLETRHDDLAAKARLLQQRADEELSVDRDALDAAREELRSANDAMKQKQELLAQLKIDLHHAESSIDAITERKMETLEEIKAAERLREEYRGWSPQEVKDLKHRVDALVTKHGWTVVSASAAPATLTLSYRSDLELFVHPRSFNSGAEPSANAPISLSYIGGEPSMKNPKPRPLTTTRRFFLQLLRAHLIALPQFQTSLQSVLRTISAAWEVATSITEAVRILNQSCITDEVILSDDRMALDSILLLPTLQTKIRVRFEIAAVAGSAGEGGVTTSVNVHVRVLYGEKYDQPKMGEFLGTWTGGAVGGLEEVGRWADGVEDLRVRLLKRGKKGERV